MSAYADVDVTNTATLIIAKSDSRQQVEIVNTSSSVTVYLGMDSSVASTTGLPLYPNQGRSFTKLLTLWAGDIYGITASGTADCRYWEVTDKR